MNEPVLARLQHLMNLREEVETLSLGPWLPLADWTEEDIFLLLHLDVPGIDGDSLELHEDGNQVTIAGKRAAPSRLLNQERPYGIFTRTLQFPQEVLPQTAEATLKNGILTIRFNKRHPTININSQTLAT